MEITTIHLDMVQSVALAIVSYYIGMWIKSHSSALQRFSIPAPVIGGLPFALVFSLLKIYGIADFTFDDTLQKVALLCFFTTIGMMASLKLVKKRRPASRRLLVHFNNTRHFTERHRHGRLQPDGH